METSRRSFSLFAAAFVLAVSVGSSVAAASSSGEHSHREHDGARLSLDSGKKWETDKSLSQGMLEIKRTLEPKIKAIHEGTLSTDRYVAVGEEVTKSVESIFKNCKLRPEADAMLHLILAKALSGASTMKDRSKPNGQRAGAVEVVIALKQYGNYFRHPGWTAIEH